MGRRSELGSALIKLARATAQAQRHAAAEARRRSRETAAAERSRKRAERDAALVRAATAREERAIYVEIRESEVATMNEDLARRCAELETVLAHTLRVDDTIAFQSLRLATTFPQFIAPSTLEPSPPPHETAFTGGVRKPSPPWSWFPWVTSGYEEELHSARAAYADALSRWGKLDKLRRDTLARQEQEHAEARVEFEQKVAAHNEEIERFEEHYRAGEPNAVVAYNMMVLERSDYPDPLESEADLRFNAEAYELAVDFDLPDKEVIPAVLEHRYVKSKDTIDDKPRKATEVRARYRDLLVSICLRTIHEVFEADQGNHINSVVFNGWVHGVDPATGRDTRRCLIAVRAKRKTFLAIDLARVELFACLRSLGGEVAKRPDELEAVEPVIPYGENQHRSELEGQS